MSMNNIKNISKIYIQTRGDSLTCYYSNYNTRGAEYNHDTLLYTHMKININTNQKIGRQRTRNIKQHL